MSHDNTTLGMVTQRVYITPTQGMSGEDYGRIIDHFAVHAIDSGPDIFSPPLEHKRVEWVTVIASDAESLAVNVADFRDHVDGILNKPEDDWRIPR